MTGRSPRIRRFGEGSAPLVLALLVTVVTVVTVVTGAGAEPGAGPAQGGRRQDLGDLIAVQVTGSHEEVGRQLGELLEPELRALYPLQLASFERGVAAAGARGRVVNALLFPLWSAVGGWVEDSGFTAEMAGTAEALGVSRTDLIRASLGLVGGGSTVFAATRSATADGRALLGRNVDWSDAFGRRRPLVVQVRPEEGELAYVYAAWPMVSLPTVGVNEAGFALSFNYFETDPQVGLWLPAWPHRLALQRARSVEEGIEIFREPRLRGISAFMVMADAEGEIAMVECTTADCAVFRPQGDWFAQANHARTPEMIPHDLYRAVDSFDRRAAMEAAVEPHLGSLEPGIAARILRDRSNLPWANASTVGNLSVLNAAVVHPASRTLWHSTTMQPHAPFGEYVAFTAGVPRSELPPLPADPALDGPALRREAELVAQAREGLAAFLEGRFEDAAATWDAVVERDTEARLDPARLAFGRAVARWHVGELEAAAALLAEVEPGPGRFDVVAHALVGRARLADALGRRDEALDLYRRASAHLDTHPEYASTVGALRPRIEAGLEAPDEDLTPPALGWLLRLPG